MSTFTLGLRKSFAIGCWAMFLASVAVLVAPIYLAFSQLFTMNAFDPLLWTLIAWFLVELVQTGEEKNWLWAGILTGITLLNKCGVLFFVAGLLAGVALSSLRRSFARPQERGGASMTATTEIS